MSLPWIIMWIIAALFAIAALLKHFAGHRNAAQGLFICNVVWLLFMLFVSVAVKK